MLGVGLAMTGPGAGIAASESSAFRVIAHRGASAHAPENTLPAFRKALALGAREVELDVQLSRDRVPVLFHDKRLGKKTNLEGAVRDHTAADLTRADIGSWFDRERGADETYAGTRLITLDELFAALGDQVVYHVELKGKSPALPALVLERVRRFGLERDVFFTSFSREQLLRVRRLDSREPATTSGRATIAAVLEPLPRR